MDDLPRTFRREKEARLREARERAAQERAAAPSLSTPDDYAVTGPAASSGAGAAQPHIHAAADFAPSHAPAHTPGLAEMPYPASVRRFDVPFLHLVAFFLKAVFAAIPAIVVLIAVLWVLGAGLQAFFPDLVKMKILIGIGG